MPRKQSEAPTPWDNCDRIAYFIPPGEDTCAYGARVMKQTGPDTVRCTIILGPSQTIVKETAIQILGGYQKRG